MIAGNVDDEQPLAAVDIPAWTRAALAQVEEAASSGVRLIEVGNEMTQGAGLRGVCAAGRTGPLRGNVPFAGACRAGTRTSLG